MSAEQPIQAARRRRDLFAVEPSDLGDLAELRLELAAGHVGGKDEGRVSCSPRIDEREPIEDDVESGLLPGLADRGLVRCLAALHAAAGEHPFVRVGRAHDEDPALGIGGVHVRALDAGISAGEEAGNADHAADEEPRKIGSADAPPTAHRSRTGTVRARGRARWRGTAGCRRSRPAPSSRWG